MVSRIVNRGRDPRHLAPRRILVSKVDEIGDVVLALHVFEALRRSYPGAEITAFVKPYARFLVEPLPSVDRVVSRVEEFAPPYDLVVELRGTLGSALWALRHRPGYRVDRGAVRWRNKHEGGHRHETVVNLQIAEPVLRQPPDGILPAVRLGEEDRRWAEEYIGRERLGRFAVLHPGARKVLKQWPPERYARLAERLHEERGWSIVVIGTSEDAAALEALRAAARAPLRFVLQEPLLRVAALAARAEVFVGNDSGPMHVAAAAGAVVIGLFGPGSPTQFAPVGPRASYLHHRLPCNPCDHIHCVEPATPCIRRITVEEVLARVPRDRSQ
jgi:ADP-heptose:LPS heptosyltransferase